MRQAILQRVSEQYCQRECAGFRVLGAGGLHGYSLQGFEIFILFKPSPLLPDDTRQVLATNGDQKRIICTFREFDNVKRGLRLSEGEIRAVHAETLARQLGRGKAVC